MIDVLGCLVEVGDGFGDGAAEADGHPERQEPDGHEEHEENNESNAKDAGDDAAEGRAEEQVVEQGRAGFDCDEAVIALA
ncbi:MAG: hypothetical protein WDN23_12335 [Edaphobacter sp.]